MTRFRKVLFIGLVCFLTIGVSYLYAGEIPLPEGYVADGKPISATMTIIQVDETDYSKRPFWFKLAVRISRLMTPIQ